MEFDIVRYYLRIIGQNIVRYIVWIHRTIYRSDISCDTSHNIFRHPNLLVCLFLRIRFCVIVYRDSAVSITAAMLIRCLPLSFSTCALTVRCRSNKTSSARSALVSTQPQQEHQLEATLDPTRPHQLEVALQ